MNSFIVFTLFGSKTQMVEQEAVNFEIVGSNPTRKPIFKKSPLDVFLNIGCV
jgi:hypothetical protein